MSFCKNMGAQVALELNESLNDILLILFREVNLGNMVLIIFKINF